MKSFILTLLLVSSVVAVVTTFNNGISNTSQLRSSVHEQSFIVYTVKDSVNGVYTYVPTLEPKKLSRSQLETYALSVGCVYNVKGQKIQVNSFKDLPKGVYIIRVGYISYKYYK